MFLFVFAAADKTACFGFSAVGVSSKDTAKVVIYFKSSKTFT